MAAGLLTGGLVAMNPASATAQETGAATLPEGGGPITLVGCFLRVSVGHEGRKFVLARPMLGSATSVTEPSCTTTGNDAMVELDDVHKNVHKHHLDRSQVGRWIEVTGRLDKVKHQTLREVHVETYRAVPVVPPAVADFRPVPEAPVVQPPLPLVETDIIGTTGVLVELPQTASSLPLIALLGFLSFAAALALRRIELRRTL
jgi:hypothetical protein